jgi:dihydrofolate synthase/folylpolyglutamate synthase
MDYSAALRYLDRFVNFEVAPSAGRGAPAWDLAAFERFLDALGRPHRAFPSVLVAGTKGKGSVATLVARALAASGRRVGLYTSPHLSSPRERIAVGGDPISEEDFAARVAEIAPQLEARGGVTASYRTWFEIVTAAAFLQFRARQVDIAVLEVGLGGRLDATNVVDPLVSVVTSISRDHTKTLGDTLGAIAREKAGILRRGGAAVIAPQPDEALGALLAEAARLACTASAAGRDYSWRSRAAGPRGSVFDYRGDRALDAVLLGLAGAFQVENAAVALRALEALAARGFAVEEAALRSAFAAARWPGRFELLAFDGFPALLLDGAHNDYSIEVLLRSIAAIFPGRRTVALFGVSKDKEWDRMLAALCAAVPDVVFTESASPRAAPAAALLAHARRIAPRARLAAEPDPLRGLDRAIAWAPAPDLVLATGSLYLVGALRDAVRGGGTRLVPPRGAVLDSTALDGAGAPSTIGAPLPTRPVWSR